MSDASQLSALLDRLHEALRAGRFGDLPGIEAAIHAACASDSPPVDRSVAEMLRRKAQRNERLLAASLRGLRGARRRIDELQALSAGYATYDGDGRVQHHPTAAPQLTRRF